MYGIAPSFGPEISLIIALAVWLRLFWRRGRFSILSLLVLTMLIACWLGVFRPWEPRGMF